MSNVSTLSDAELFELYQPRPDEEITDRFLLPFASWMVFSVCCSLKIVVPAIVAFLAVLFIIWQLYLKRYCAHRSRTKEIKSELEKRFFVHDLIATQQELKAEWAVSIEITVLPVGYDRNVQVYLFENSRGEMRVIQKPGWWSNMRANKLVRKTLDLNSECSAKFVDIFEKIYKTDAFKPDERPVLDGAPLHFKASQLSTKRVVTAKFNLDAVSENSRGHPVFQLIEEMAGLAFSNDSAVVSCAYDGKNIRFRKF